MSDAKKLEECVERLLRENNTKLKDLVQHVVQRIAGEFWTAGLIDKSVESSMGTRGVEKSAHAKELLDACHDSLVQQPRENFPKFIDILRRYETMKLLAAAMESEFQQVLRPSAHPQHLPKPPIVHPQPVHVHNPPNAHQDKSQRFQEWDGPPSEESEQVQQLGEQGNESAKPVYTYPMEANPHGQAVIFNFIGEKEWPKHCPVGSKKSVGKFKDTFESLGFEVNRYPFLSREDMIKRMTENITDEDDSFVCCIMAHGSQGIIVAKDKRVEIHDLQKEVGEKCQELFGKPKIFIIQACRGTDADVPMDASKEDTKLSAQLSREADFYIAYSTTEGHIATMNEEDGCLYLNTLCRVFKQRAAHLTLDEMVMEVHQELKREVLNVRDKGKHIQMGQVVHTLRGAVRFKKA